MDFKALNQQIKQQDLRPVYILTGSEEYLKDYYLQRLSNALIEEQLALLNRIFFEGAKISAGAFLEAADSYPFMAEKKLIVLKNTGVFTRANKNREFKEALSACLSSLPPYLHVIFVEDSVEKSSELLALGDKNIVVVELEFLKAADLTAWITKQAGLRGKKMTNDTVAYFIEKCDSSLYAMMRELDKLAGFLGDIDTIKKEHIDMIVTRSLESRIFDLVDSLVAGKKDIALQILNDLKELREPEIKISSVISQHFIGLSLTQLQLAEGATPAEIAKKLKKRDFVIRKYMGQLQRMDLSFLQQTIDNCVRMDVMLKTSGYEKGFYALEQFVFSYGKKA